MKIRVMLVDDHTELRQAMCMFLELQEDIEAVLEVADGSAVLTTFREGRIDVVCMDIGLRELSGINLTRQLLASDPSARVVGLSGHSDLALVARMVDAGAFGYVIKGCDSGELLKAIRAASQRQYYFDATLGVRSVGDLAFHLNG